MKQLLKHIWDRINAETPKFWKKVMTFMLSCVGAGAVLKGAPVEVLGHLPHSLPDMLVTVGTTGTLLSKLTITGDKPNDPPINP